MGPLRSRKRGREGRRRLKQRRARGRLCIAPLQFQSSEREQTEKEEEEQEEEEEGNPASGSTRRGREGRRTSCCGEIRGIEGEFVWKFCRPAGGQFPAKK